MKLLIIMLLCVSPAFAHPHHDQVEEVQPTLTEHEHHHDE